jgi:hypothetical protein
MKMPNLPPLLVTWLSRLVAHYISSQRAKYFPRAQPLSRQQKAAMAGFFTPELLDNTRLLVLAGERIVNPRFYPLLRAVGFMNLPDQSTMAAMTLSDTVVSHEAFTDELLFHELVHVEQYRQLGVRKFAELYVRGFLYNGGYDGIPLERSAYLLGDQFERDSSRRFSVAESVSAWIAEGLF